MASPTIRLYQRVALTTDLPTHSLYKGDVAVVVEHLPGTPATGDEDGYALEVFNAVGETIAVVMVPASAVQPLTENEIFQVRPLSLTKPR
jgi:Domain of unknown function (DUF4926)